MPPVSHDFEFASRPDPDDVGWPWRISRTPPIGKYKIILVSSDFLGVYTHYRNGRTIGHKRSRCEACKEGNRKRWTGYILALEHPTPRQILFEFPAGACESLALLQEQIGSLRGAQIVCSREKGKPNGSIIVEYRGRSTNADLLPDDEPIIPILFRIWGVLDVPDSSVDCSPAPSPDTLPAARTTRRRVKPSTEICEPIALADFLPGQLDFLSQNGETENRQ